MGALAASPPREVAQSFVFLASLQRLGEEQGWLSIGSRSMKEKKTRGGTMSQSATEKTVKTPARLSKNRVIKTMTKLAGKLEEDSSTGLPTIKIAGVS